MLVYGDSLSFGVEPCTRKRVGFLERWLHG
jgi:hypothetical protein